VVSVLSSQFTIKTLSVACYQLNATFRGDNIIKILIPKHSKVELKDSTQYLRNADDKDDSFVVKKTCETASLENELKTQELD
jgi:hypothetical protein